MSLPENNAEPLETQMPRLRSFIRRRVNDRDDADDLLQDVLLQWVRATGAAMEPIDNASAWLMRVAHNRIINFGIKKREERLPERLEVSSAADSPEAHYLRGLFWEALERALAELPPAQRSIFYLTEFEGIPVKEIAEASGMPVATLLSRKHYAVLHLRKRLRTLYEELIRR